MSTNRSAELAIPDALISTTNAVFPQLTHTTVDQLTEAGWSRVGLMVPLITRAAKLLMFEHNETPLVLPEDGRKTTAGMIGPLGETSKGAYADIEQPLETLHRGLIEETGIREPNTLDLRTRGSGGWFINRWPVGVDYPDKYACAICPPVYVPAQTEERLLSFDHGNEEISSIKVMSPAEIRSVEPSNLRPGVLDWLDQLESTGYLEWPDVTKRIDFKPVFAAAMMDLHLQLPAES